MAWGVTIRLPNLEMRSMLVAFARLLFGLNPVRGVWLIESVALRESIPHVCDHAISVDL